MTDATATDKRNLYTTARVNCRTFTNNGENDFFPGDVVRVHYIGKRHNAMYGREMHLYSVDTASRFGLLWESQLEHFVI